MKYLIKNTEHGVLVKDVSSGKVKPGKGFKVVDELPDGPLYKERAETNEDGVVSLVRDYFTSASESDRKDGLYAEAFGMLLGNRSVHEEGVSYPALSKLALAEMEKSPSTVNDLVEGVLSAIASS